MAFDVLMNGIGNAFSLEHWGTNFLLRDGDFVLAVDCPDSYRRALAVNEFSHGEAELGVSDIDAMFVTHLHGDHVNGLEMTLVYRALEVGEPLDLYVPPPVADDLWEHRLGAALGQSWDGSSFQSNAPEDFYTLHTVSWEDPVEVGPFELVTRQTLHHLPAAAIRVTDGEASVGYSCDTVYEEDLVDWLAEDDVIFHETSPGSGHTSLSKLRELPEEIRRKLLVVHLPDEVWERGSEIDLEFAEEGRVYAVEPTDR